MRRPAASRAIGATRATGPPLPAGLQGCTCTKVRQAPPTPGVARCRPAGPTGILRVLHPPPLHFRLRHSALLSDPAGRSDFSGMSLTRRDGHVVVVCYACCSFSILKEDPTVKPLPSSFPCCTAQGFTQCGN